MSDKQVGSVLAESLDSSSISLVGKGKKCHLCGDNFGKHLRRHIFAKHLPWYTDPTASCWECEQHVKDLAWHLSVTKDLGIHAKPQFTDEHIPLWCRLMFGILVFFSNYFNLQSVSDLLVFVKGKHIFPESQPDSKFNFPQIHLMHKLCEYFELGIPKSFCLSPPNHVVCILHWQILARLIKLMDSDDDWNLFKKLSLPIPLPCNQRCTSYETYVDSHCHLDKIFKGYSFRSVLALRNYLSFEVPEVDLEFVVSNFVFPYLWDTIPHLARSSLIYGTIGVHPHHVDPLNVDYQVSKVADFLQGGEFVGVGEVGLDFTGDCHCKPKCPLSDECKAKQSKIQAQRVFLDCVLPLAEQHHLALVLHCRDSGSGAAAKEVLNLVRSKNLSHLQIHRHCFIGCLAEMRDWLEAFPNVMFGFTSKSLQNVETCEALRRLPIEKLLIETDAPYLKRTGIKSPWQIQEIVKGVSEIKNIPMSVIRAANNTNTRKMYGIV